MNPRILSVILQGNEQARATRPSHDDVKSFVQRSEEVFRAEEEKEVEERPRRRRLGGGEG